MREVLTRTGGSVRLWPATLYNTLKQLLDETLIEESGSRARASEDQRRMYHRLTRLGRRVLDAELARLEALIKDVREDMHSGRSS